MSQSGTLAVALAFVPNWWQETTDPLALDMLLGNWARACDWRACGFVLPVENAQPLAKTVQCGSPQNPDSESGKTESGKTDAPLEVPDALRRIRGGETSVLYSAAGSAGRVFAAVQPL